MSLETQLARYRLAASAEGLSQKNISHVTSSVRHFASFLGGIEDVSKVTKEDLQRFIVALQARQTWQSHPFAKTRRKLSPATINTYCRGVKAFWSWLKRDGVIKTNPLESVIAPKLPKRLPKTLTEAELTKVLKAAEANDRDNALVTLFLDSGMRLGELANLRLGDIDQDSGVITVIGKGDKQGHVFISKEAKLILQMYLIDSRPDSDDDHVFLTEDGRPLSPARIQKILEKIGKKAGLSQRLSPHKLRHSYATLSLKYGANLEYLRRSLRHTSSKVTEVYLSVCDADVQMAHRKFSPVANLTRKR